MSLRRFLVAAALAGGGCGFSMQMNPSVTRSLPYHAHYHEIEGYPLAKRAPLAPVRTSAAVTVQPFVGYYPRPTGFYVAMQGFTRGTSWGEYQLPFAPEAALPALLGQVVVAGAGPHVTVQGVVTDFEFYAFASGKRPTHPDAVGGRMSSRVTVVRDDGAVLFEGDHTTEAQADDPGVLLEEHARGWLADPAFVRALGGN